MQDTGDRMQVTGAMGVGTASRVMGRRLAMGRLALGVLGCWSFDGRATSVSLPGTDSLAASLSQALHLRQPLVVMVSLPGCPFCKVVRENYLHPLRESGLYVVQIDMRDQRALVDFDGALLTQDAWIRKMGIRLAPTVLFFGAQGREVAARLKGAYLPDFYGAYLDDQLATARRAVSGR